MKSMKVARMVLVGVVAGATALLMTVTGVQAATYTWTPGGNGGNGTTWDQSNKNWDNAAATWSGSTHDAVLGSGTVTLGAHVYMKSFTGNAGSSISGSYNLRLGTGSSTFSGTIGVGVGMVWDLAAMVDLSGTNNNTTSQWVFRRSGTLRFSSADAWKTNSIAKIEPGTGESFTLELAAADESFNTVNLALNNAYGNGNSVRFAAIGADRTVTWTGATMGGSSTALVWDNGVAYNLGDTLGLGNANATHKMIWASGINLNGGSGSVLIRKIDAINGSATVGGEISGVISDSGTVKATLQKTGSGTLILSGTNTYSGATVISNGTLLVHGLTTNSAMTVVAGSTLGGTGKVGTVTVNTGGIITGNGTNTVGTLTATNLSISTNAVIYWNYDATAGTADLIHVAGTLTLPTNVMVKVSGTGELPNNGLMFSSTLPLAGASDLINWSISGPGVNRTTFAVRVGNDVYLKTSSGTIITLQ